MPFGESNGRRRAPGADQPRTRQIFLHRTQTEMAHLQHGLQTRFADAQGRQARRTFPVLEPHRHERALFQIDNGANPETGDQL